MFSEPIIWQGHPRVTQAPRFLRALAWVALIVAAISAMFAAVVAVTLHEVPVAGLAFSVWCVLLGVLLVRLPRAWAERARYLVTDKHVIIKYGPFSRSIERAQISFARIYWNQDLPDTGDLEVVRAVPTGALRRRLRLRLDGLVAPDRVWAIVRGAEDLAPAGHQPRPLGQRLDQGETVLWSGRSRPRLKTFLPRTQREWLLVTMALFLLAGVARILGRAVPMLERLPEQGMPRTSFSFIALGTGMAMTLLLMLGIAGYILYDTLIRPGILARETHYIVTNKRVLIQRRNQELHLDRARIIDVIDTPAGDGLRDVFLVLDGPRARAAAVSGAFGELGRGPSLRPVLEAVADAEGLSRILRTTPDSLPHAA